MLHIEGKVSHLLYAGYSNLRYPLTVTYLIPNCKSRSKCLQEDVSVIKVWHSLFPMDVSSGSVH